jgi:hypothetical protein
MLHNGLFGRRHKCLEYASSRGFRTGYRVSRVGRDQDLAVFFTANLATARDPTRSPLNVGSRSAIRYEPGDSSKDPRVT